MALLIEMVVDRRVDCSELLQTSHLSEAEHSAFSSSKRQVGILGPIIYPAASFLPIRVADDFHCEEQPEETITEEPQVSSQDQQPIDKKTEASFRTLDMLEKGLLTEKVVLAVIGTHEDSYTVAPDVRIKALELVEAKKLSKRGLVAILGV